VVGHRSNRFKSAVTALFLLGSFAFAGSVAIGQTASSAHYDSSESVGPSGQVILLSTLGKSTVGLQLETVKKALLPLELTTPGKIEPIPSREFAQHSPVSGRVSEVMVDLGSAVQRGQVLLELESPEINRLAGQILQSKQDLESQMAQQSTVLDDEVTETRARVQLAQETFDRDQRLVAEKIGAQKQLQTSQADLNVAKAQLKAAQIKRQIVLRALENKLKLVMQPLKQQLEMLGASGADVENMLSHDRTVTTAPVRSARNGVITAINASAGQGVDPSIKLFTVSDLSRVWATAQIYEDDMSRVKLGQKVKVRVSAFRDKLFDGILSFIGDHVDVRTRTLPVRAEIANADLRLKPDMYAELIIQIDAPVYSVLLPHDAVVERNGHSLVFVEVANGYQPTRVEVGRSFGDKVEILDGVNTGQKFVVRGAFQLTAEMLKSSGNADLFQQATQGDHESTEIAKDDTSKNSNTYTIGIAVCIAFVLGFVISAIAVKASKAGVPPPVAHIIKGQSGDADEDEESAAGDNDIAATRREKL